MKNTKRDETFLRETRHVIERHIELYPKCEPDDIVKLLYQSEFGCGHFVRSKEIAEEYLKREYEACMLTTKAAAAGEHPLTDETGGMFVRVRYTALKACGAFCAFIGGSNGFNGRNAEKAQLAERDLPAGENSV